MCFFKSDAYPFLVQAMSLIESTTVPTAAPITSPIPTVTTVAVVNIAELVVARYVPTYVIENASPAKMLIVSPLKIVAEGSNLSMFVYVKLLFYNPFIFFYTFFRYFFNNLQVFLSILE